MSDPYRIESEDQLREVIAEPSPHLEGKLFDHVDPYAAAFIEKSPLVMLATSDSEGRVDVSPKGDAPGFVHIQDEKTLIVPERIGNKLAYGFRNILGQPHVGMIFVVPGVKETLRINGGAELTRNPELLGALSAKGKPALLATRVHVEECFFHCGKAFVRSSLWKPESWPKDAKANIGKQIARKAGAGDDAAESIEKGLLESYETRLY